MKVIIAHNDTRRQIDGDFDLCANASDLISIAEQIMVWIGDRDHPKFSYGVVPIRERVIKTQEGVVPW
jgi:hypothetical protein